MSLKKPKLIKEIDITLRIHLKRPILKINSLNK